MKIESQQSLFPQSSSQSTWSTREEALKKFQNFNPTRYAKSRNFLNGHISHMSPQIKHGVIQNKELLNIIQDKFNFQESEKFIQELAWRDFWRSYAYHHPDQLWTDVEEYKTGFGYSDYLDDLPEDQLNLLKMNFFEEKSHGEIAELTKIPLGTVKSRIRLALEKIRGKLEQDGTMANLNGSNESNMVN